MRGAITLLASSLVAFAAADPLGTKASPAAFDASPVGMGPVFQMLIALALVGAGVKFALPWIVARLGGRMATGVGGSIRVEESATFPGGKLYIVEARGRTLLLGATSQNINLLADLTVASFDEALAIAEVPTSGAEVRFQEPPSHDVSVKDALARLERLGR